VRGIVLNAIDQASDLAVETNPAAIRALAPGVPLLLFPWIERVTDDRQLAGAVRACGLDALILSYGD